MNTHAAALARPIRPGATLRSPLRSLPALPPLISPPCIHYRKPDSVSGTRKADPMPNLLVSRRTGTAQALRPRFRS